MKQPLVSVIVPCFNVAETVEETIASISAQSFGDFEIIAVDNNSTDDTREILLRIASEESRLRIIEQKIQGLCPARNAGIEAAKGMLISFLDADDLWDPSFLAEHRKHLSDATIDISFSRVRRIDAAGKPTGKITAPFLNDVKPTDLLSSNPCTALIVARSAVFEKIGGFEETLRATEDQELLFRAAVNGFRIRGINKVLSSYRVVANGLSANLGNMLRAHGQFLEVASTYAPELIAKHKRTSRAAMLRYCARRAIEQNEPAGVSLGYLKQMFATAPDLLLREPGPTLKVSIRTLVVQLSDVAAWMSGTKQSPKEV